MIISDLDSFLHYFRRIHQRTLRVIDCIPENSFNYRPSDTSFTLSQLIVHIANINFQMYGSTIQGRSSTYTGHSTENISDPKQYYIDSYSKVVAICSELTKQDFNRKITTPANVDITCWKWLRAMTRKT